MGAVCSPVCSPGSVMLPCPKYPPGRAVAVVAPGPQSTTPDVLVDLGNSQDRCCVALCGAVCRVCDLAVDQYGLVGKLRLESNIPEISTVIFSVNLVSPIRPARLHQR